MGHKLTIDFGTTNSLVAHWDEGQDQVAFLPLPGLSLDPGGAPTDDLPPLVPSLLYVQDGATGQAVAGQAVGAGGLDGQPDNRLFRNFKRGILAASPPDPRLIDGIPWTDQDAGRAFIRTLLSALPYPRHAVDQLVLTAPVASFSGYLAWLSEVVADFPPDRVRVVDESTAAALGYAVTEPGALVLVCDLGGGTLDLSLVQLPESRARTGGFLSRLRRGGAREHAARVIAKGGRLLGGSDVDQWLLAHVLDRADLTVETLGHHYAALLTACEKAKIALSTQEATNIIFSAAGRQHAVTVTRRELEALLDAHGFYTALRGAIDRVMHIARRQGVFQEDIHAVLLVGGVSLMPAVQRTLRQYFAGQAVRVDRPFTAVAEGALQVAAGYGLEDYLAHSYGLRHLNPGTGRHEYDEIIAMGSAYPTAKPVEVVLSASRAGQAAIELVVGEIAAESVSMVEVRYEGGQTVFVAQAGDEPPHIIPLNETEAAQQLVRLDPIGQPGEDRIRAAFRVDDSRQLRVTVTDLKTRKTLMREAVIATLGESAPAPTASQVCAFDINESLPFEEQMARFREELARAMAPEIRRARYGQTADQDGGPLTATTGHEPCLASGSEGRGERRLSLRRLGTMLNALPPEAISLEAAAVMLRSEDFYVRHGAGGLLARRGDRDARRILQEALADAHAPTRASAARHLYAFSWFAVEPLLRQALADPDHRVREAAIYALCDRRDRHAYRLAAEALRDEVDDVRRAAAWRLRDHQDLAAIPVLEAALLADDPDVRAEALESLGTCNNPEALAVVRRAIDDDPDPYVKYAATLSLIELAGEACLADLADILRATDGTVCQHILRGLFQATNYLHIDLAASQAVETLLDALAKALRDPAPETRLAAVWPLAWMGHGRAPDILVDAYRRESDSGVKGEMLRITRALMSPAGEVILADALASEDQALREAAARIAPTAQAPADRPAADSSPILPARIQ